MTFDGHDIVSLQSSPHLFVWASEYPDGRVNALPRVALGCSCLVMPCWGWYPFTGLCGL
jgi:hypothetical protein